VGDVPRLRAALAAEGAAPGTAASTLAGYGGDAPASCSSPTCQYCPDCVSACTCAGYDYSYCVEACNGGGGAVGSGGYGGSGAVGGYAGSPSCDSMCPSTAIPTVILSLSGCCLPDGECGVSTDPISTAISVEGGCQAHNQVGYFDGQCPSVPSPVGGPLAGCCRPDGRCGNDLGAIGLGCVRAAPAGGGVSYCNPFEQMGTGGASSGGSGGGSSIEECVNNAQSDCERCACKSCNGALDPCFKDAGCPLILQCANQTQCSSTDCYQPSTCQSIIDEYGGLSGPSLQLAVPLFQCVRGCGCGFAPP